MHGLTWLDSLLVILLIFICADLYRDLMLFLKIGKCLVISVMVLSVFFLYVHMRDDFLF